MIENTRVQRMPITSVIPTVLIGMTGTIAGMIMTENPTMVVKADMNTATPVVLDISRMDSRYRTGSQMSGIGSSGRPCLRRRWLRSASSSSRLPLLSSIRLSICRA